MASDEHIPAPQASATSRDWRSVLPWLLLALTGFRLAYYGSAVPNTFFAKVGGLLLSMGLAP